MAPPGQSHQGGAGRVPGQALPWSPFVTSSFWGATPRSQPSGIDHPTHYLLIQLSLIRAGTSTRRFGNFVGKPIKCWLRSGTPSAFPGSPNPAVPAEFLLKCLLVFIIPFLLHPPGIPSWNFSSGPENSGIPPIIFFSQHSPFPPDFQSLFFKGILAALEFLDAGSSKAVGILLGMFTLSWLQLHHPEFQPCCWHCAAVGRLCPRFALSGLWGSGGSQECLEKASGLSGGVQEGDISKITSDRGGSEAIWKEFPWRRLEF